jgi:hypothetical protein
MSDPVKYLSFMRMRSPSGDDHAISKGSPAIFVQ